MSEYTPRIYVADLADYVNGKLRGEWFTVLNYDSADDLLEAIGAMLKDAGEPGHEEWAIHDTDDFAGIRIGEYENLEQVFMHAKMLAEHGDAWAAYVDYFSPDSDEDYEADFEDRYRGEYASGKDFAEELYEDIFGGKLQDLPSLLRFHIDWGGIWRDLLLGGDYVESYGYIFEAN